MDEGLLLEACVGALLRGLPGRRRPCPLFGKGLCSAGSCVTEGFAQPKFHVVGSSWVQQNQNLHPSHHRPPPPPTCFPDLMLIFSGNP